MYLQRWHGWCHMKLLPSWRVLCTPYNHAPCHFMQSHIRKVHECLAVTCHLHFWQNGWGLLRATVVRRGWNGYLSCLKLLTCMYYHASSAPPFLYQKPKWKKIHSQSGSSTSWRGYIKISFLSWSLSKNVSRFYSQPIHLVPSSTTEECCCCFRCFDIPECKKKVGCDTGYSRAWLYRGSKATEVSPRVLSVLNNSWHWRPRSNISQKFSYTENPGMKLHRTSRSFLTQKTGFLLQFHCTSNVANTSKVNNKYTFWTHGIRFQLLNRMYPCFKSICTEQTCIRIQHCRIHLQVKAATNTDTYDRVQNIYTRT